MLALVLLSLCGDLTPEAQLALTSLRSGERDRLEKAVGPLDEMPFYRVSLEVDPKTREVSGSINLTWFPHDKPATELLLRVTPNAAQAGRVKLSHATVNGTPTLLEQPEPTLYRVRLDPVAMPGTGAIVQLHLQAKLPAAPEGSDGLKPDILSSANKGDYGAFIAAPEVMTLTGIVPMVAPAGADGQPMAGPAGVGDLGTGSPSLFLVSIVVPAGYEAVSGGNALGEVPERNGAVRFSWGLAGARDFPLLVTKGYEKATAQLDDITVESRYLAADEGAGKKALGVAKSALAEFQKRLGPYPYSTFRVVEARLTGGAGGMEFPGLVTVATSLYRGHADPLGALGFPSSGPMGGMLQQLLPDVKQMMAQTLEFTVAHEVAHQYFAMLVGSDPIASPVADEPLTQHAALLYMEWKYGKKAADNAREMQLKMPYQLHRMLGGDDGVADRPTADFNGTQEYAALIYGKAPLLFDALRAEAGDAAYFKALRSYVDEYRYRWVTPDTFTRVLSQKVPGQAKAFQKLQRRYWRESHGDQDVGKGDFGDLSGVLGGQGAAGAANQFTIDPQTQKMIEDALKAMEGQ